MHVVPRIPESEPSTRRRSLADPRSWDRTWASGLRSGFCGSCRRCGVRERSAAAFVGCPRHNPTDPRDRRVGVERQGRQDDTHPRVEQARHRAEDARNADLRRFRRVAIVRPASESRRRIRDESLASQRSVLPILLAPPPDMDDQRDERIRERLKAHTMSFRPTTLVVVTSGLIAAAGLIGCQVPRTLRSFELRSYPWRRVPDPRPRREQDQGDFESYVPKADDVPNSVPRQTVPDQPQLRLPPEPTFSPNPATDIRPIPVPPAAEFEEPQARRWKPSTPNRPAAQEPQYTSQSGTSLEEFNLPPARVTYNTESTTEEPTIAPAPEHQDTSPPRLFRPAGSAKNMIDTMKRKLTR